MRFFRNRIFQHIWSANEEKKKLKEVEKEVEEVRGIVRSLNDKKREKNLGLEGWLANLKEMLWCFKSEKGERESVSERACV